MIHSKSDKTSLLLIVFGLMLVGAAILSEIFQTPPLALVNYKSYLTPISPDFLRETWQMELTNRLGSFRFQQAIQRPLSPWELLSPRHLPASSETMQKVLETLQSLKVRKVLKKDPLSITSFSFDRPLLQIHLTNQQQQKITFSLGMINPIDNSAYITFSHKNLIYQIDELKFPLETLGLTEFVNSKVFSSAQEEISSINIYKGKKSAKDILFAIKRKDHAWQTIKGELLAEEKVTEFLDKVLGVKGQIILDLQSEQLQRFISQYTATPQFVVEVTERSNVVKDYFISHLLGPNAELKLDQMQNIVISASDRQHPYIASKEYLTAFNSREKDLLASRFQRFIY